MVCNRRSTGELKSVCGSEGGRKKRERTIEVLVGLLLMPGGSRETGILSEGRRLHLKASPAILIVVTHTSLSLFFLFFFYLFTAYFLVCHHLARLS